MAPRRSPRSPRLSIGNNLWTRELLNRLEFFKSKDTGLLPQEARELCPTLSRDLPRQQAPFCRGPASVSHEKSSPPNKNRKKSRGHKIDLLPLEKSLFSRRKHADFTARAARFFRIVWRAIGAKGRDLSLGFSSSEKTEGTLPEELDRAKAIPLGGATSK